MNTMRTDIDAPQGQATQHARAQKGNVLIEFALILPVFLALLFGMITFSIALYDKTVLTMATREGARAGAMYVTTAAADIGAANTAAANIARSITAATCQNSLISFGTGEVNPTITASVDGNKNLTVGASIPFTGIYVSPSSMTISANATMRTEYQ